MDLLLIKLVIPATVHAGRWPPTSCQVVLQSFKVQSVSRHHFTLRTDAVAVRGR